MTAATSAALDILKTGGCAPSCLLGDTTRRCHCRCGGTHHGELLTILTRQTQTTTRAGKLNRATRRRPRKGRG